MSRGLPQNATLSPVIFQNDRGSGVAWFARATWCGREFFGAQHAPSRSAPGVTGAALLCTMAALGSLGSASRIQCAAGQFVVEVELLSRGAPPPLSEVHIVEIRRRAWTAALWR